MSDMTECPACWGDGAHDCRDSDAIMAEHLDDRLLAKYRMLIPPRREDGTVVCETCGGTGVVTEEERLDLMAAARAFVDQIAARFEDERRRGIHR